MKTQKEHKEKKIQTENPEVAILKNQLVRTLADYDNLRKRTDEERVSFIKYASQEILQNLLPVLDTLENAQVHLKDSGLQIAISQFKDVLKQEGLEEINPKVGENFDENLMEVIDVVEEKDKQSLSGIPDNTIAEVLTSGWKFADGQVIRHAKVKVFKAKN
jgi:molecular chaperone GrpE